jgi:hypothetical protein
MQAVKSRFHPRSLELVAIDVDGILHYFFDIEMDVGNDNFSMRSSSKNVISECFSYHLYKNDQYEL